MSDSINEIPVADSAKEELRHFLDIPVRIVVQLADRTMAVREILQLRPEAIIELPKSAGENVDILMNDRLVAYGEVMQLEGRTGIRVTDFKSHP